MVAAARRRGLSGVEGALMYVLVGLGSPGLGAPPPLSPGQSYALALDKVAGQVAPAAFLAEVDAAARKDPKLAAILFGVAAGDTEAARLAVQAVHARVGDPTAGHADPGAGGSPPWPLLLAGGALLFLMLG